MLLIGGLIHKNRACENFMCFCEPGPPLWNYCFLLLQVSLVPSPLVAEEKTLGGISCLILVHKASKCVVCVLLAEVPFPCIFFSQTLVFGA